jgi:transcription-repair coupling factor (superfamily II helicase)
MISKHDIPRILKKPVMLQDLNTQIRKIRAALSSKEARISLPGLKGSAPAYIISRLLQQQKAPFLIILPDTESAEEWCRELRFYAGHDDAVLFFPPWEAAPFDPVSPHPSVTGERLHTLYKLMGSSEPLVVTTTVGAVCQKLLPRRTLGEVSEYLLAGEETDRDALLGKLLSLGYSNVPLVEDRGTFSVRGGILDIFPPDQQAPLRIEFFGDFVETIREFDPVSQRSLHTIPELILLPSREIVLTEDAVKEFTSRLKKRCDFLEIPATRRRELLEQVQHSIYPQGVEYLQPLFHPGLETLFDYMAAEIVAVLVDPEAIAEQSERFAEELCQGEKQALARDAITCATEDLYLTPHQVTELLAGRRTITIPYLDVAGSGSPGEAFGFTVADNSDLRLSASADSEEMLRPLVERLIAWLAEKKRVVLACHQPGQAHRLHELLVPYSLPLHMSEARFTTERRDAVGKVEILVGEISHGFRLVEGELVVIAEEEIFGKRLKRRGISEVRKKQILTSLAELKPGDYMVHIDFGVGLYKGLQHLTIDMLEGDFLLLEYAGGDKLYLPVDRINLVQRYVGSEGMEPALDKLGGTGWEKKKAKVLESVREMAEELLKIYAARMVHGGFAFSRPDDLYREFEASFAFEETPDQLSAIEDVLQDMATDKPMDRLICGDVGYGKTEVAMRGAFKAAMDGKQVAVLVPTTVLAQQHLETFRKRFEAYPVKVEMVSRFRTPKEQKAILDELKKGDVDVIIGTHRLLQKDIEFKDLGLVIIDEEHRFGVAHKEKMKQYRSVVDVMTLTATPIPRTLHMSLSGIRELSIIDTPPVDRLSIKTFVARFSDELIREAILRELRRGGQVFFVHNRVQSIHAMAEYLKLLVPEAKLAIGHGQMNEKELEQAMLAFMHGESNLFLCTTIIESGLDIPNANTMIVNRADTFGLAQLYQLRGRVGRSRQRAFAYLLIPGEGAITSDARERLKIMQELTELGAGFRIATHDLEIRGAGDLLGAKQSGNIATVGFELYTELLEEAVSKLKGEDVTERVEPEINLKIPAFIPEDYIQNPNQRLVIYKKLAQSTSEEDIDSIQEELIDRFGKFPLTVSYLLEIMKLRIPLKTLLVKRFEFDGKRLICAFHEKTPVSPDIIISLIRQSAKKYRFTPDFRLYVELTDTTFEGIIAEARNLLKRLT